MDKQSFLGFLTWLGSADVGELRHKHREILDLMGMLRDPDIRSDAKRMLRLIEQEIIARLNTPKP